MFHGSLKDVSRKFNGCLWKSFKGVSRMFQALRVVQWRLRDVLRYLQGSFRANRSSEGVSREFLGSFKDVLRKFQGCSKKNVFEENFKSVS